MIALCSLLLTAAAGQANDIGDSTKLKGFLSKYIDDITAYSNGADASNSFGNYNKFITPSHMKHGDVSNAVSHHSNFAEHGLAGGSAASNIGDGPSRLHDKPVHPVARQASSSILDDRPVLPIAQPKYSMPMVSTKDHGTLNAVDKKEESREVEKMLASHKANTDTGLLAIGVILFMFTLATALAVRPGSESQPALVLATRCGSDMLLAASDDHALELQSKGTAQYLGSPTISGQAKSQQRSDATLEENQYASPVLPASNIAARSAQAREIRPTPADAGASIDDAGVSIDDTGASIIDLQMAALNTPDKLRIQEEARSVAAELEALFPGYSFKERGSLWSHHVRHISDCDLLLFGSTETGLEAEDATRFAAHAKFMSRVFLAASLAEFTDSLKPQPHYEADLIDFAYDDFVSHIESRPAGTRFPELICSLVCECEGGWLLPFDLALIDVPGIKASKFRQNDPSRMDEIAKKVEEGDFAKVLQKIRTLLWGRGRLVKEELVRRIDDADIGKLRFLVTQLDMLGDAGSAVDTVAYVREVLGIDVKDAPALRALHQGAFDEMQSRARRILVTMRPKIAPVLNRDVKEMWLKATCMIPEIDASPKVISDLV